jgi:hypothetical protein
MTKKKIIGITAASLVLGTSIFSASASSWNSANKEKAGFGGRDSSGMTALIKATTENNYEAWKVLMQDSGESRFLEMINTEEKFKRLVEANNLRENGDFEEADAIMQELGILGRGGMRGEGVMQGERPNDEDHEAIMLAIEAGDYATWKTLSDEKGGNRMSEAIENEEDFSRLVEAHRLMQSGDREGAEVIFKELGVDFGGPREGRGEGKGFMSGEQNEAVETAIENSDYSTWKKLMEERGGKILEIIDTEDEFKKFAEAKNLQKSGDYEAAKEILDALGFPFKERGFARFGAR